MRLQGRCEVAPTAELLCRWRLGKLSKVASVAAGNSMTQLARPLGIGIIGCGSVMEAYVRLAEKLQAQGLARVVAVCGREHQRMRVMSRLPEATFYMESPALIESPDVDIVVILTPMSSHAALAKSALSAGKHVLVEKPLATTLEDATELVELACRSN